MRINKSRLAREMAVVRRTISKYLEGFSRKTTRDKDSKIDEYYEVIAALLSTESRKEFYYKRVLWQYLMGNHGLDCSQSAFRAYITRKPEFKNYISSGQRLASPQGTVRFEIVPGKQAQLDWKESISFETKEGDKNRSQCGGAAVIRFEILGLSSEYLKVSKYFTLILKRSL